MKVTAQKLYDEGMKSLKVMLPLFDSGKDITASRIIELIKSILKKFKNLILNKLENSIIVQNFLH